MAFIPIAMMAYDCYVDKVYYNLNTSDKTASVTNNGYGSYSGSVTIPSSFWYNGIKYSMTSIGDYAFNGSSYLTSITIPSSVTSIGEQAFEYCSSQISITIPSSVTSIGKWAFRNCSGLTSVTVENPTPVTIEYFTFTNRSNATLYVPLGSKSAYQAEQHWKDFKEIIEYDNRPEQTLSLMEIPSKTYGDAAYTLPETTAEGLTITWSSSDTNVATISGNTLSWHRHHHCHTGR